MSVADEPTTKVSFKIVSLFLNFSDERSFDESLVLEFLPTLESTETEETSPTPFPELQDPADRDVTSDGGRS